LLELFFGLLPPDDGILEEDLLLEEIRWGRNCDGLSDRLLLMDPIEMVLDGIDLGDSMRLQIILSWESQLKLGDDAELDLIGVKEKRIVL